MFIDDEEDQFVGYFSVEAFASRLMGSFEYDQFCVNYKKKNGGYDIRQTYNQILQKDIRLLNLTPETIFQKRPKRGNDVVDVVDNDNDDDAATATKTCRHKTPFLFEVEEKMIMYTYFAKDASRHSHEDVDAFFRKISDQLRNEDLPILKEQFIMFKKLFDYISKLRNDNDVVKNNDVVVLGNDDDDDFDLGSNNKNKNKDKVEKNHHHHHHHPQKEELDDDFHFLKTVCGFLETTLSILDMSLNSL